MDRILFWAVQLQGQWRSISTELTPDRDRGWSSYPSQRSGGCSTITEEREVSWSWEHPSRPGWSRWRGCNRCFHDNLQQDLADRRMANPLDPLLGHHNSPRKATCSSARTTKWSASSAIKAKSYWRSNWTDWSCKQRRSLLKNKQASDQGWEPQSRSSTWESFERNISSTSKTCSMSSKTSRRPSTSFMGNHSIKHQYQP